MVFSLEYLSFSLRLLLCLSALHSTHGAPSTQKHIFDDIYGTHKHIFNNFYAILHKTYTHTYI